MKYNHYFLYFFLTTSVIYSKEYLYPVAHLSDYKTIFLIHQKYNYSIELLIWDCETNQIQEGLWSLFNPAGFQLLPDESGFSFIDNGRLRIKYFNKRSPKVIDFDNYFYNMSLINWINSDEFYCSVYYCGYYAVFHCQINGSTCCIASSDNGNYMYPQKVNSHLFYIEQVDNKYHIMHTEYPEIKEENNRIYSIAKNNTSQIIVDFGQAPIAFLTMLSDYQGFVIEAVQSVDDDSLYDLFNYYQIIKTDDNWQKTLLFSFAIPSLLLRNDSKDLLYESLLPLIPRIVNEIIYYVDACHNSAHILELCCYNMNTKITSKYESDNNYSYFVPVLCGAKIICGGALPKPQILSISSFLT